MANKKSSGFKSDAEGSGKQTVVKISLKNASIVKMFVAKKKSGVGLKSDAGAAAQTDIEPISFTSFSQFYFL